MLNNESMVNNIKESKSNVNTSTNVKGNLKAMPTCEVPNLKYKSCFNKELMTNVISLPGMAEEFQITMDTKKGKTAQARMKGKEIIFGQVRNRLCGLDPKKNNTCDPKQFKEKINKKEEEFDKMKVQMMSAVEENLEHSSNSEKKKVKKARRAHQALGMPTNDDLNTMDRMNLIKDNEVSTEDANSAENTFGTDAGSVKRKSTRVKPTSVEPQAIEMPQELINVNENIAIRINQIKTNGVLFLASTSHDSCFRMAQLFPKKPISDDHESKLRKLCDLCKKGRFILNEAHADQQFKKACEFFRCKFNPPTKTNRANAEEHVPSAQKSIRALKGRATSACHQMPFEHLPRRLVEYAVVREARKLSYFPSKHGVSIHCSPIMSVRQETLAFKEHCENMTGE